MTDETRQAVEAAVRKYAEAGVHAESTEHLALLGIELMADVCRALNPDSTRPFADVVGETLAQLYAEKPE